MDKPFWDKARRVNATLRSRALQDAALNHRKTLERLLEMIENGYRPPATARMEPRFAFDPSKLSSEVADLCED